MALFYKICEMLNQKPSPKSRFFNCSVSSQRFSIKWYTKQFNGIHFRRLFREWSTEPFLNVQSRKNIRLDSWKLYKEGNETFLLIFTIIGKYKLIFGDHYYLINSIEDIHKIFMGGGHLVKSKNHSRSC